MEQQPPKSFLSTFFGSFVLFKEYPQYAQRSWGSVAGHYCLLLVLACSLYALAASSWLNANVSPHLQGLADQIPEISIKDGTATVGVEQPYIVRIEDEPVLIIDTTGEATPHLEKYEAIAVLTAKDIVLKKTTGEIETRPLMGEFEFNKSIAQEWIATVSSWFLPAIFILCFAWQFTWKAIQVLVVAGVVTIANQSRPGFAEHLRLATYALGPAMAFGLAVFFFRCAGGMVPFAGFIFWAILGGITYHQALRLRNSPLHS